MLKARPANFYARLFALGLICVATACAPPPIDRHVHEYIRLAVALGERDPDSIDFYYGPPEWVADIRKDPPKFEEIRRSALELDQELEKDRRPRAVRLRRQVRAIAARAGQLIDFNSAKPSKSKITFDQEASVYFGLTVRARDESRLDAIRAEIDRLLPGKGSAAERYAAFDEKFLVPPDRLPAVIARAMQGCRDQTRDHLRLPGGEGVTIEYVHDKPWSAFSYYQGNFRSVIQVNADLVLTVDRALALACHEGYPGHHAYNVTQELQFVRERHWPEWMVQPTFSPQSLVSEALGTIAADVAFPGEERVRFERGALFPLAGLNSKDVEKYDRVERLVDQLQSAEPAIARDYLDGKLEFVRAADTLEKRALMAHAEETLKYINEYRSYMLTYTLGRDLASREVRGWQRYEQLMTDPDAALILSKIER